MQGLTARILLPSQLAVWSWENGLASVQLSYSSVKNGDRNSINLRAGVTINREYACRALSTCLAHDKCSINRRCHYHHRDIKLRETSSLLTASTDAPPTATHLSPPPHVPCLLWAPLGCRGTALHGARYAGPAPLSLGHRFPQLLGESGSCALPTGVCGEGPLASYPWASA